MVILHDGIKTIQNGFFLFSLKKEQNLVSLKKNSFFNPKKTRWVVFLKKSRFFSTLVVSHAFIYHWVDMLNVW